jgi:hypothetical protein
MVLADILSLDGIVKILGAGLAGFGFLLMYLAFQLIQKIITTKGINMQVFKTIRTYMVLCFCMTIVVGVFTIMSTVYKNDTVNQQAKAIDTTTRAIKILAATQQSKSLADTILKFPQSQQAAAAKTEQKKALDTITKYVAKTAQKPLIDSFAKYKTIVVSYPDSIKKLTQEDPTNKVKAVYFQQKYLKANEHINLMTHSLVAKAVAVKAN